MTTSDLKSGLRRALTNLESSLLSNDGSLPSQTDDLNTPEERLAARMVRRLSLQPPVDVLTIAKSLATVTEKLIPGDVDGLCLDLKVPGKRPKVWLSRNLRGVRRRFTLAHEIGHIIIPWHIGSVVDDVEAPRTGARGKYKEIEAEANRFAAELLMPHQWVQGLFERSDHLAGVMHTIKQIADVSFLAALFRVVKFGPPGYVGALIKDGTVEWSGRTKGTWSLPPDIGTRLDMIDMPAAFAPRIVANDESRYYWWQMREEVEAPNAPETEWREVLEQILLSVPIEFRIRTRARINAIIGYVFSRLPKGTPVDQIYGRCLAASQNRTDQDKWVAVVIAHPDYDDYLLGRAHDRANAP